MNSAALETAPAPTRALAKDVTKNTLSIKEEVYEHLLTPRVYSEIGYNLDEEDDLIEAVVQQLIKLGVLFMSDEIDGCEYVVIVGLYRHPTLREFLLAKAI